MQQQNKSRSNSAWTSEEEFDNLDNVVTTQVKRLSSAADAIVETAAAASAASAGGSSKPAAASKPPKIITEEAVYTEDKVSFLCFTWRRKKRDVTTRHQENSSSKIDVKN